MMCDRCLELMVFDHTYGAFFCQECNPSPSKHIMYRLPCRSCGFMSCQNRVQCEKDARFDIDRKLRNWYPPDENDNGLSFLVSRGQDVHEKYLMEEDFLRKFVEFLE